MFSCRSDIAYQKNLLIAPRAHIFYPTDLRFADCMNFVDWSVLIAILYYLLFKVLVDWATVSGAAAAVANNQQQGHSNPHQSSSATGVPAAGSAGNHQQNFLLKPRNNRTPGEGTCYEIGKSTCFFHHTRGKGQKNFHLLRRK